MGLLKTVFEVNLSLFGKSLETYVADSGCSETRLTWF